MTNDERLAFLEQWRKGVHEPHWCTFEPRSLARAARFVASDGVNRPHYGMTGQEALIRLRETREIMARPTDNWYGPTCSDGGPCTA